MTHEELIKKAAKQKLTDAKLNKLIKGQLRTIGNAVYLEPDEDIMERGLIIIALHELKTHREELRQ